jgi:hypothetical protein
VGKAALVEEIVNRLDHHVADPGDGDLLPAPEPEVAVLEEELGPVLLGRDGKVGRGAQDLEIGRGQLEAARGAGVLPDQTGHRYRGLLGQRAKRSPDRVGYFLAGEDRLERPGAVAQHQECDLAAGAGGDHPAPQNHGAADVAAELVDVDRRHRLRGSNVKRRPRSEAGV